MWSFSKLLLITTPAWLAGPLPLVIVGPSGAEQGRPVRASILTVSDAHDALGGIVVRVRDGLGIDELFVTDEHGWTPRFDVVEGSSLELAFRETPVTGGIAMGQLESWQVGPLDPTPPADEQIEWVLERSQPVAMPVVLEPGAGAQLEIHEKGHYGLWSVFTPPLGSFRFQAHVAVLIDEFDVRVALAYQGIQAPVAPYRTGLAMRTRRAVVGAVDGPSGIVVRIDCDERIAPGAAAPILDAFHFATATVELGEDPPLAVTLLGWLAGQAFVHVDGTLPEGWLVLALRDAGGAPGALQMRSSEPPTFPWRPAGSGSAEPQDDWHLDTRSTEVADAKRPRPIEELPLAPFFGHPVDASHPLPVTDCVPSAPNPPPGWSCTPPSPGGPCAHMASTASDVSCVVTTVATSDAVCLNPGEGTGRTRTRVRQISVKFSGTVEGGYTTSSSSTTSSSYTSGPGAHGLGTCYQTFAHVLVCAQNWTAHSPIYADHWVESGSGARPPEILDPCGSSRTITRRCQQQINTSNTCSREP